MDEAVEEIIVEADSVRIQTNKRELRADRVILAVPAHTAKILYRQSGDIESALMDTPYSSTLNLALGTAREWALPRNVARRIRPAHTKKRAETHCCNCRRNS